MRWKKDPGIPNIQAPISHGGKSHDYVISHRRDQHTVSYRPPGRHEHVGTFTTETAAKAAAEAHAKGQSVTSSSSEKKTKAQLDREIAEALTSKPAATSTSAARTNPARGIPRADATAWIKQIRAEVRRIGADVTLGRVGTGKYQEIALWGSDANAVTLQLEQRGFQRTTLSGIGTRLSPITVIRP
jgi:hypothetical protein